MGGAPPLGTIVAGRYTLARFLGAGGMGAVYEATGPGGGRFALKILFSNVATSKEALERFRRESILRVRSPHVVPTVDEGIDRALRVPFLVMPLLVGHDLESLIMRVGPVHPTIAVRIIRQACKGVADAHAAGIIHRDIKPANIFLDHSPSGEVTVRILDFGIAKLTGDVALTRTGFGLGTPDYTAPEQLVDAKHAGPRSDVWSLGMTLYHAIAGDVPYESTELTPLLLEITQKDIRPLQDFAPWVDPALARLVHGTLLREPGARCPSAEELAAALEPHAFGNAVVRASMLQPLSDAQRALRARRAVLPVKWTSSVATAPLAPAAVPEADKDPMIGRVIGARYRLLRALGEGGMGAVYEACNGEDARVAVKVIRPELAGTSSSARRRFVREATVLRGLESPHIVKVFEVAADPEHQLPFIVMELLQGIDLDRLIEQTGALEPATVARLFAQAAAGLAAAHERGVVHRDVKPANLFLAKQPCGDMVLKICDFGVAGQLGSGEARAKLTRTGGVIGSPMYMPPEQAVGGQDVDLRSDVWSLGAAMFEALSGAPPWAGRETFAALVIALVSAPIPHLRDRAPWVPSGLADIVRKAMEREPALRFQTVGEMAEALAVFTEGSMAVTPKDLRRAAGFVDATARLEHVGANTIESPATVDPLPPSSSSELAHSLAVTSVRPEPSQPEVAHEPSTAPPGPSTLPPPPPMRSDRLLRLSAAFAIVAIAGITLGKWVSRDDRVASAAPSHAEPAPVLVVSSAASATVTSDAIDAAPTTSAIAPGPTAEPSASTSATARSLRSNHARPHTSRPGKPAKVTPAGLVPYFEPP